MSVDEIINQELSATLVKKLGFDWPDERVIRIAKDAGESIAEGTPAVLAFALAVDTELIMYGDGRISDPIGLDGLT